MLLCFVLGVLFVVSVSSSCTDCSSSGGHCQSDVCVCNTNYYGVDCSLYNETLTADLPANNSVQTSFWKYYNLHVSKAGNTLSWLLSQTSSSGDCDLYIQYGHMPDFLDYEQRNNTQLPYSTLNITDSKVGTYYAGVYGYIACDYQITVNVLGPCVDNCSGHGVCVYGSCRCDSGYGGEKCDRVETAVTPNEDYHGVVEWLSWNYFTYTPQSPYDELDWVLHLISGNCDLYLSSTTYPTFFSFDYVNISLRTTKTIVQTQIHLGSKYYCGVRGSIGCEYKFTLNSVTFTNPTECPNHCSSHGSNCRNNFCVCQTGYTGTQCEEYLPNLILDTNMTGYVGDNAWNYFHIIDNTVNSLVVTVRQTSDTGDCDLYVRGNAKPTRFDYQYVDISTHTTSTVTIVNPQGTTWYIGVFGWYPCEYELSVHESVKCGCSSSTSGHCETDSPTCICNNGWAGTACDVPVVELMSGVPTKNNQILLDQWLFYVMEANSSSAFSLTLNERNTTGMTWVFLSHNQFPTFTDYDFSDKNEAAHIHQISGYHKRGPQTGQLYIGVYGSPYIYTGNKNRTITFDMEVWVADF
jgi:hypothetical protein